MAVRKRSAWSAAFFARNGAVDGILANCAAMSFSFSAAAMPNTASRTEITVLSVKKLPIAVMGLNAGENMFVRDDGLFEAATYIPAYIRRYPFVFANDDNAKQMVLCVDRAAEFVVDKDFDQPFFGPDGHDDWAFGETQSGRDNAAFELEVLRFAVGMERCRHARS